MTLDELRALATVKDGPHLRFQAPYRQMSVTLEEADFLYALVRALKPKNVLELGTGLGLSAFFIASALKRNGDGGKLLSIEVNPDFADQARFLLRDLPASVAPQVTGDEKADLVYIDSGTRYRPADIAFWLCGVHTGLVLVHDAERQYPELEAGAGVYLPTANGMWLGRSRKATEAT